MDVDKSLENRLSEALEREEPLERARVFDEACGGVDHPNIAKVLDAGATETGRPYLVWNSFVG